MQKFCHNCGKPLTVGAKFCSSCGTSLSSLSATPANTSAPAVTFTPVLASEDDDRDGYIDGINHLARIKSIRLSGLEVEITKDRQGGETFGAMCAQAELNGGPIKVSVESRGEPYKNIDQKTLLAELQKEAGALRNER
jgi:hypothetical protein